MRPPIDPLKIVVFSGAGISAESGIPTFRDEDGHWRNVDPEQVASAQAWANDPEAVLDFYNERFAAVSSAQPNAAHRAVCDLERRFDVVVITQNVDDLHERAGSSTVIHLHGSIVETRADGDPDSVQQRGHAPIKIGDVDDQGRQLRPNIVLFGEEIMHYDVARSHLETAGRVLVVGTSLQVFPAAGMLKKARFRAEKIIVAKDPGPKLYGFKFVRGNAAEEVPSIVSRWMEAGPYPPSSDPDEEICRPGR